MRLNKETDISKHIKENGVHGIWLLFGSEDYLINRWKEKLTDSFEDGGFNFSKFDGQTIDFNEVYDAAQQMPMFASEKCVLIDDLDIKKSGFDTSAFESIIEELPPETVLIITSRSLDSKSAAGKKLVALADKKGVAVELAPRDTAGLVKYLQGIAQKSGCELASTEAKEIIRLCGNEMQTLTTEMAKVVSYTGTGQITVQNIEAVVIPKTEEKVFDLGKMILAGNTQRALEILSNLFYLRESPVMIVATLAMSYADLYRARIAKNDGKITDDVVTAFGYKGREFRVRNAYNVKISQKAIRKSLEVLYNCDRDLKSTGQDGEILLETAALELIYLRDVQ